MFAHARADTHAQAHAERDNNEKTELMDYERKTTCSNNNKNHHVAFLIYFIIIFLLLVYHQP